MQIIWSPYISAIQGCRFDWSLKKFNEGLPRCDFSFHQDFPRGTYCFQSTCFIRKLAGTAKQDTQIYVFLHNFYNVPFEVEFLILADPPSILKNLNLCFIDVDSKPNIRENFFQSWNLVLHSICWFWQNGHVTGICKHMLLLQIRNVQSTSLRLF